ncbi:MAG TPA: hypothetical protein VHJ20_07080 [Polyangia bacterium]|nr:hypothetical protein [Polyangia bacterium]
MKDLSPLSKMIRIFTVTAGVAMALAGCGGGSGGGETGGTGGGGGGGGGAGGSGCDAKALFLAHGCLGVGCHTANNPAANFDMTTAGWETKLVGTAPTQVPASSNGIPSECVDKGKVFLVKGSNPATGLFMEKLKNNPSCGLQMPFLQPALSTTDVACIQTWANGLVAAAQ